MNAIYWDSLPGLGWSQIGGEEHRLSAISQYMSIANHLNVGYEYQIHVPAILLWKKWKKKPPLPGTPSRSELRCNFPVHYLTLSGSFLAAGGDRDVRLRVDATWKMMDLADGGFLKLWYPKIIQNGLLSMGKTDGLGYPYFRKPPYWFCADSIDGLDAGMESPWIPWLLSKNEAGCACPKGHDGHVIDGCSFYPPGETHPGGGR